jgi:hypothetical protein
MPHPAGIVPQEDYSDTFNLTGATAQWSQYELDKNFPFIDAKVLPCSSFDCVRKCFLSYPPHVNSTFDNCVFFSTFDCVIPCPGVNSQIYYEELYEGNDAQLQECNATKPAVPSSTSTASQGNSINYNHFLDWYNDF